MKKENIRIIKKDLVYVLGIPEEIAEEQMIVSKQYFGQYGEIKKIVLKPYNRNNLNNFCAYITYATEEEATVAVLALDNYQFKGNVLKVTFGMTKYCQNFLKKIKCPNQECLYLHKKANDKDCFDKETNFNIPKDPIESLVQKLQKTNINYLLSRVKNNSDTIFPPLEQIFKQFALKKKFLKSVSVAKKKILMPTKWSEDETQIIEISKNEEPEQEEKQKELTLKEKVNIQILKLLEDQELDHQTKTILQVLRKKQSYPQNSKYAFVHNQEEQNYQSWSNQSYLNFLLAPIDQILLESSKPNKILNTILTNQFSFL